jgi:hypothetical protein
MSTATLNDRLTIRHSNQGGQSFVALGSAACPICGRWNAVEHLLPVTCDSAPHLTGDTSEDWATIRAHGEDHRVVAAPLGCDCTERLEA